MLGLCHIFSMFLLHRCCQKWNILFEVIAWRNFFSNGLQKSSVFVNLFMYMYICIFKKVLFLSLCCEELELQSCFLYMHFVLKLNDCILLCWDGFVKYLKAIFVIKTISIHKNMSCIFDNMCPERDINTSSSQLANQRQTSVYSLLATLTGCVQYYRGWILHINPGTHIQGLGMGLVT